MTTTGERIEPRWSAGLQADLLRRHAAQYAEVALANIAREYPYSAPHVFTDEDDVPARPRAVTPVFGGSFDWHSCVEMYWLLVRLLRVAPEHMPADQVRTVLRDRLNCADLAREASFAESADGRRERPYGWGWALALAREVALLDDPDGETWSAALAPLARTITEGLLEWLPRQTYPVRYGLHPNTAFSLSRCLPYAQARAEAGDWRLAEAIARAGTRWFSSDADYPATWEPSGSDFLSPALTEAELMARLLPPGKFATWLTTFLPGIARGEPRTLFMPVTVTDSSDGQLAHLHGLNASRAWCWHRIARSVPPEDPRTGPALAATAAHAAAALPHVIGDDYMVEHWLVAYAVLLLT